MKKNRVLVSFILEGTLTVFFYFPKILVLLCVVQLKEKKISENWKIQYIHMVQPSKMVKFTTEVLKIKIYMIYF